MVQLAEILVPIDYSPGARAALQAAIGLRARLNARRLTIMHVFEPVEEVLGPAGEKLEDEPGWEERAGERLAEFVRTTLPNVGEFETLVRKGRIADEILAAADERTVSLIVSGTHGRTGFERLLVGSVAEEIVRRARCPVLTVREREEAGSPPDREEECFDVDRILLPTDFSEAARVGLHLGAAMAAVLDAEVHLLHVVDRRAGDSLPDAEREKIDAVMEQARNNAVAAIAREREALGAHGDAKVSEHVCVGLPAKEVAEQALALDADLIVMGSQGRTSLPKKVLGSTAEVVVRLSTCPVLTVRTTPPADS